MPAFEVVFYRKPNGQEPVRVFLDSLDLRMRASSLRMIEMLKNNGNELREPYSKLLRDGVFELRIKSGSNISRILYFFVIGRKIILTNGFVKKTEKTPPAEIEEALHAKAEFLSRKEK